MMPGLSRIETSTALLLVSALNDRPLRPVIIHDERNELHDVRNRLDAANKKRKERGKRNKCCAAFSNSIPVTLYFGISCCPLASRIALSTTRDVHVSLSLVETCILRGSRKRAIFSEIGVISQPRDFTDIYGAAEDRGKNSSRSSSVGIEIHLVDLQEARHLPRGITLRITGDFNFV